MINAPELLECTAAALHAAPERARHLTAFIGLDGFVDEIVHVVDKRADADHYERLPTIAALAARLAGAAGMSTNIELVNQRVKLGGNGPIMANALASFGLHVTYLGSLGYPLPHPVFADFARRAEVYSIGEPGHTDALEFEDGKLMLGKLVQLKEITWANIQARFGRDKFAAKFNSADLVGFVNWTMIPYMSDIWDALLAELCPALAGPRRKIFFDLADPAKRPAADIRRALELIARFSQHFDVILGLNEKEASEVAEALGLRAHPHTPEELSALALEIARRVPVDTLVVHPVTYALAVTGGVVSLVAGPRITKVLITTGAGDHFNSGFCLGKLLGLDNAQSLLCGVSTSGSYVRSAQSPGLAELAAMMRAWPQ